MITVAILLPVDNRRYFTIGAILDNRLVLTINRTKLLDYRKNDFHLLCSSLVCLLYLKLSQIWTHMHWQNTSVSGKSEILQMEVGRKNDLKMEFYNSPLK